MKRASEMFSLDEQQAITAAIAAAEQQTAGEIVPVVATASGRYDRSEDLFGLLVAVIAVMVTWIAVQEVRVEENDWASAHTLALGLGPILVILVGGFFSGALLATWLPALRLPFISRHEMREEVERSAAAAFQKLRLHRTAGGSGVLIYVSLYEHMVRVLADDGIGKLVSPQEWEAVCNLVVDGLRRGRAAEGLIAAIGKTGELLARHAPGSPTDRNQIVDQLHLID